ncbi:zinc finger protein 395-like isoform X1, partial [Lates japonicus]
MAQYHWLVTELQQIQAASNSTRTMAPLGMVDTLGWFSSPEAGIISLVVFLILSITLVALCGSCHRNSTNAYDVSGITTDGAGGANGTAGTKTAGSTDPGQAGERRDSKGSYTTRCCSSDGTAQDRAFRRARRCDTVLSPLTACSSTMAAMGPEYRAGAGPGGMAACPSGLQARSATTTHNSNRPDVQQTVACSPVQVSVAPRSPGCQGWTPATSVSGHSNTQMVKPRCRSVSVGEQWLQQNRHQPLSASPSRTHCSF